MQTTLRKKKRRARKIEITAKVFPVNHFSLKTPQIMYIGTLMSAFKRSANARFAIRMFGKERSFLTCATMARINPLPITAKIARTDSSKMMENIEDEEYSASIVSFACFAL